MFFAKKKKQKKSPCVPHCLVFLAEENEVFGSLKTNFIADDVFIKSFIESPTNYRQVKVGHAIIKPTKKIL